MARSLNRVQLIGNLTRDPELRYTPTGAAVCSFGIATNRTWTTDTGDKHEETEFHNIVAWNKLAEICSRFLVKGRKVYVEGRLATRSWTGQDGQQRQRVEVVIDDMILLDSRRPDDGASRDESHAETPVDTDGKSVKKEKKPAEKKPASQSQGGPKEEETSRENASSLSPEDIPDDIPF